jgi:hypothetical protein
MTETTLTIDEQARLIGHAVWQEQRCFEVLGGWIRSTAEPATKLAFAAQSHHHGTHARLLEPLLPSTRDHDPATFIVPPDDAWPRRLDEAAVAAATDDRTAAARALLDAVVASHEAALAAMTPVADAPATRALRAVVADEREDRAAG